MLTQRIVPDNPRVMRSGLGNGFLAAPFQGPSQQEESRIRLTEIRVAFREFFQARLCGAVCPLNKVKSAHCKHAIGQNLLDLPQSLESQRSERRIRIIEKQFLEFLLRSASM